MTFPTYPPMVVIDSECLSTRRCLWHAHGQHLLGILLSCFREAVIKHRGCRDIDRYQLTSGRSLSAAAGLAHACVYSEPLDVAFVAL
jgi:hypothetical protein